MKKALILLAGALVLAACKGNGGEEINPENKGTGSVSLTLEPTTPIEITSQNSSGGANKTSRATTLVDLNSFAIDILDDKGTSTAKYSTYSEFPSSLALNAGMYNITSENNGVSRGAAWDKPYYAGTAPFKVVVGETTPVKVVCDLKNTGVKLLYADELTSKFSEITAMISISLGDKETATLFDDPSQTRDRIGWFSIPADSKITISGKAKNTATNDPITFSSTISGVKAKELRTVTLNVKTTGSSSVVIEVDKELIEKEEVIVVPDADDIIDNNGDNGSWDEDGEVPPVDPGPGPGPSTDKPQIVGKSHEGQPFEMYEVLTVDRSLSPNNVLDVLISSKAAGGIQNLFLTIETDHAEFRATLEGALLGITGEIDLANPPSGAGAPGWASMFADPSIGLIDPAAPIAGKSEHLFSVGGLMFLLGSVDTEGGVEHRFTIRVVDANGQTTETLTLMLSR